MIQQYSKTGHRSVENVRSCLVSSLGGRIIDLLTETQNALQYAIFCLHDERHMTSDENLAVTACTRKPCISVRHPNCVVDRRALRRACHERARGFRLRAVVGNTAEVFDCAKTAEVTATRASKCVLRTCVGFIVRRELRAWS